MDPEATEAATRCVEDGFRVHGLDVIIGLTHPDNTPSQRVLEKAGLEFVDRKEYFGMECCRYRLDRASREADGSRVLAMRQSCGAVWLRLAHPSLVCEGADEAGRLLVRSTREQPEVRCRLRGADLAAASPR